MASPVSGTPGIGQSFELKGKESHVFQLKGQRVTVQNVTSLPFKVFIEGRMLVVVSFGRREGELPKEGDSNFEIRLTTQKTKNLSSKFPSFVSLMRTTIGPDLFQATPPIELIQTHY